MKHLCIVLCSFVLLLYGCNNNLNVTPPMTPNPTNSSGDEEKTLEQMREEALTKIDVAACEAGGGTVRQAGILGLPLCVTPYDDAGKTCHDTKDCEGRCMGHDDVTDYDAMPGKAFGRCEVDDSPFGCFAEIEHGTVTAMLCVD